MELWARTSPLQADSDGGGETDGSEIAAGGDPLASDDDAASVFTPAVAPGHERVIVDLRVPFMLDASVQLQRAAEIDGTYELRFSGLPPADNIVIDPAPNDAQACYRMRTTIGGATSDWSTPLCVTPRIDPLAPLVQLSLLDRVTKRDQDVVVRVLAADVPDGSLSRAVRTMWPAGQRLDLDPLLDPTMAQSGVVEMLVSTKADFSDTSWELYQDEVVLPLADSSHFVVYAKVRDVAGNESLTATLSIRPIEVWPHETIVGLRQVRLQKKSAVSGDITVVHARENSKPEVIVGHGAKVSGSVRADGVKVKLGGAISSTVFHNTLSNHGMVGGSLLKPLFTPVNVALPDFPEASACGKPVTLKHGKDSWLTPGSYGKVKLKSGKKNNPTVLTLAGGYYTFVRLLMSKYTRLECATACEVRVAKQLAMGPSSYVGPQGDATPSGQLELFVGAGATVGNGSKLVARLFAPNATLRFKKKATGVGTFVARRVVVGTKASVKGN